MFDSMAMSETLSDMHSVGMIDDSLYLIEALNTNITLSVNTPMEQQKRQFCLQ